jgi:hypothetical protein
MNHPSDVQIESAETRGELMERIETRKQEGWVPIGEPHEVRVQVGPKLAVRRFVVRFQPAPATAPAESLQPAVVPTVVAGIAHPV